ncbi:hypothetical protein [Kitasatospora sp. NPDC091207]|uniref:hypothetical protein n=1 Tax=Kitasatospora sp. NPDC091207 TaxID=3364083 RepID=UPI00382721E7
MDQVAQQTGDLPAPDRGGSADTGTASRAPAVRVEKDLLAVTAVILDRFAALADQPAGVGAAEVAWHLREAAGRPPRPSQPLDRELLVNAAEKVLGNRSAGRRCVVDATTVYEAVAALRHLDTVLVGEPLGQACRRLWERLYLCVPLTTILSRGTRPAASGFDLRRQCTGEGGREPGRRRTRAPRVGDGRSASPVSA